MIVLRFIDVHAEPVSGQYACLVCNQCQSDFKQLGIKQFESHLLGYHKIVNRILCQMNEIYLENVTSSYVANGLTSDQAKLIAKIFSEKLDVDIKISSKLSAESNLLVEDLRIGQVYRFEIIRE